MVLDEAKSRAVSQLKEAQAAVLELSRLVSADPECRGLQINLSYAEKIMRQRTEAYVAAMRGP